MRAHYLLRSGLPAILCLLGAVQVSAEGTAAPDRGQLDRLARVRVPFVENRGQLDRRVAFSAPAFFGAVFVTRDGKLVYSLPAARESKDPRTRHTRTKGWTLTETLVSGRPRPVAGPRAAAGVSYFHGNDPRRWQSDLPTYEEVRLGEVWRGIAVTLRALGGNIEKLFTVQPAARVERIRLRVDGAKSLRVDSDGGLVAGTSNGEVRFTSPLAYQEQKGVRRPVDAAYVLHGTRYGFRLGRYDHALPVVIDPLLQSTYLGGSGDDWINAIAVHPITGEVLVAGGTWSPDFPGTVGGAQPAFGGPSGWAILPGDGFVARLNPALTTLLQATYLGGNSLDGVSALAVDSTTGEVLVAGFTDSDNFPGTAGGAQPVSGASQDGFVARLNSALTSVLQATYLGGSGTDRIAAIAVHPSTGEVLVAGATSSLDLPGAAGGAQPSHVGDDYTDGFLARLNPSLTILLQSTYLGGGGTDSIGALVVYSSTGEILVAGYTDSTDFPGVSGGAQTSFGGMNDGFVARLNPTLTTLLQATYFGGSGFDSISGMGVHAMTGEVFVAGGTESTDIPGTAAGAQPSMNGISDGFVARLSPSLTTLLQTTYLGGSGTDGIAAVAIHPSTGEVLVAGLTWSDDFPGTAGGAQPSPGGTFVARLNPSLTELLRATYVGARVFYSPLLTPIYRLVAVHPVTGEVMLAGDIPWSDDFPGTVGGAQPSPGGGEDGFIIRLTPDLAASPNLFFYTLTPCRLADTRTTDPPALAAAADRVFTPAGRCGIPPTAQALSVNVTITQPDAAGHIRLYPAGTMRPLASTTNYSAGQTRAGNAIVKLGNGGAFTVFCGQGSGTAQFIVDVNGYFQ